jgi:uncharacterized membrane protein
MADLRTRDKPSEMESEPPRAQNRLRWPRASAPLGVISFGLALGVTLAIIVFLIGVTTALLGWGILVVHVLSTVLVGYEPTFIGSVTGAVWAFVDGLIAGSFMAWLYNRFASRDHH